MAINQTVSNVIKDVIGDIELKDNLLCLSVESKWSCVDRGDFRAWHDDKFNLSCANIATRFQKISERFAKFTSADILACIKFESAKQESHSTRQNSKWSRRMKFSTGESISLDNLIQCGSDHQIHTGESNSNRSATDCNEFPKDAIISVSPRKQVTGADHVNHVNHVQPIASTCPWQHSVQYYDSPFDPRLSFNGLADLILPKPTDGVDPDDTEPIPTPDTFNCLIESDCPTEFTNSYLNAHRKFLQELAIDTEFQASSDTDLSATNGDNDHHTVDEPIPDFVGDSKEAIYMWTRVTSTRHMWPKAGTGDRRLSTVSAECEQDTAMHRETNVDLNASGSTLEHALLHTPTHVDINSSGTTPEHAFPSTPTHDDMNASGSTLEHALLHTPTHVDINSAGSTPEHAFLSTPTHVTLNASDSMPEHALPSPLSYVAINTPGSTPEHAFPSTLTHEDMNAPGSTPEHAFPSTHVSSAYQCSPRTETQVSELYYPEKSRNGYILGVSISPYRQHRKKSPGTNCSGKKKGGGYERLKPPQSRLNDTTESVSQFLPNTSSAEGDVKTALRAPPENNRHENPPNFSNVDNAQTGNSNQWTNLQELTTRPGDPVSHIQPLMDLTLTPNKIHGMTVQTRTTSATTQSYHQTICSTAVFNPMQHSATAMGPAQFPYQSSVFWDQQEGAQRLQQHTHQHPRSLSQKHMCMQQQQPQQQQQYQQQQQQQQCQGYHDPGPQQPQHNRHLFQQQYRHQAPILVQNQCGMYANQSRRQTPGLQTQLMPPFNLYKRHPQANQFPTSAHAHGYSQYNMNGSHQNTQHSGNSKDNQNRSKQMAVDDEIWYFNGVPHYNARPVNQREAVTNRIYGGPATTTAQPRPWSIHESVTGTNVRPVQPTYIMPPASFPHQHPRAMFQPMPVNMNAPWNVNSNNARPPVPIIYPGSENYSSANGGVSACNLNRNSNNNNQSNDGKCRSSDELGRTSPSDGASSIEDESDLRDTNENQITVIGAQMRLDDEKVIKKKKQRSGRSGLVRLV